MKKRKGQPDYGELCGMDNTLLAGDEAMRMAGAAEDQPQPGVLLTGQGELLWNYLNEGRIYNIPVAAEFKGLKLDSDALVEAAFYLDRRTRSKILLMTLDDKDAQQEYDDLLDAVHDGRVEIVDELRQYVEAKSGFMVWVRYNELSYRLNPRFKYLLEE